MSPRMLVSQYDVEKRGYYSMVLYHRKPRFWFFFFSFGIVENNVNQILFYFLTLFILSHAFRIVIMKIILPKNFFVHIYALHNIPPPISHNSSLP